MGRIDRLDIQAPGIGGPTDAYWKRYFDSWTDDIDRQDERNDMRFDIETEGSLRAMQFWRDDLWNGTKAEVDDLYRLLRLMACCDDEGAAQALDLYRSKMKDTIDEYIARQVP